MGNEVPSAWVLGPGHVRPAQAPPVDWALVRLGEIAETVAGGRRGFTKTKDYAASGFPAYSAAGQDGLVPDWEFETDAVVVPSIGSIGRAYAASGRWSTLANTQVIFADPSRACHRFLAYRFDNTAYWPVSGTAQPYIKPSEVSKCWLLLPPLPEQKKIAAILSSVDEAIQATQRVIDQTRRVKEGILQDLLTRGLPGHKRFKQTEVGEIPESWEVRTLGAFVAIDTGFAFKSSDFVADSSGTPIVRMSNLTGGRVDLSAPARVGPNTLRGLERFRIHPGDFLMGLSGSLSNFAWVTAADGTCYLNQRVGRIRAPDATSARFASYWYLSASTQRRVVGDAAGNAQLNISPKHLATFKLGVPPADERREIVDVIDTFVVGDEQAVATFDRFQTTKRGLLQDLLTGKVRVSP